MAHAVVVGAGMAGLTAAASLARAGMEVDLFEQADHLGGVTATLRRDGYAWNLGPMALEGIAPREPAWRVLEELGCADGLRFVRGDRGLTFPDHVIARPAQYAGRRWRLERLIELFPDEALGIRRFFRLLDTVTDIVTLERYASVSGPLRALVLKLGMALRAPRVSRYFHATARELVSDYFADERLIAYFLAILADMTILPEEYPALAVPFSNQETAYDRRVPPRRALGFGPPAITYQFVDGGNERLVEALAGAARRGGARLHTGAEVTRVFVEAGRVRGVDARTAGGTARFDAAVVVASGPARELFFDLVGREHLSDEVAARVEAIPLMESVFMVHLGVRDLESVRGATPLEYYYGRYDIENGVRINRTGHYHGGRDGFLIYIPSHHSPAMAPDGAHAVTVYTIAPNAIPGGWAASRERMTEALLAEAERRLPGLTRAAEIRVTLTPEDWRAMVHQRAHHSFGGYCPMKDRTGGPHRTSVAGLWFVGSQSEAGPGVWTQIITTRNVCREILGAETGTRR